MARSIGWLLVVIAGCGSSGSSSSPDAGTNDVLALQQWRMTMTIGDFHTAGMAQAWSTMKTSDNMLCTSCHTEYGSSDELYFFNMVVQDQEILVRFFAVSGGKVKVNDDSFMRAANHLDPVPTHPPFDPATAIGLQALRHFYMLTCARDPILCP